METNEARRPTQSTTVYLDVDKHSALKMLSIAEKTSMAALISEGIDTIMDMCGNRIKPKAEESKTF